MITAVDTSVLLDVFGADPRFGVASRALLSRSLHEGRVVVCGAVLAEVASAFPNARAAQDALQQLPVSFAPLSEAAALHAGEVFAAYRSRGGRRERVVADFLIGSHALHHADRLLTRDRGFHRTYFVGLTLLDPSEPTVL